MNFPQPVSRLGFAPFEAGSLPPLKQVIKEKLYGTEILGSQLGGLVVKSAASIGKTLVLREHGGLRSFASTSLFDVVTLKGKYGNTADDIYSIIPSTLALPELQLAGDVGDGARVAITEEQYAQLWAAFSNPAGRLIIEFDAEKNLYTRPRQSSSSQGQYKIFPSVTHEQFRALVIKFATDYLTAEKQAIALKLVETQSLDAIHWAWYKFLFESCERPVSKEWGLYRAQNFVKLFEQTAKELQFAAASIQIYSNLLAKSQRKNRKPASAGELESTINEVTSLEGTPVKLTATTHVASIPNLPQQVSNVRDIVAAAISKMTEEQLRQLVLPVGHILDAISEKRP